MKLDHESFVSVFRGRTVIVVVKLYHADKISVKYFCYSPSNIRFILNISIWICICFIPIRLYIYFSSWCNSWKFCSISTWITIFSWISNNCISLICCNTYFSSIYNNSICLCCCNTSFCSISDYCVRLCRRYSCFSCIGTYWTY